MLIDVARLFVGEWDYATIEKLTEYVRSKNGKYQVEVKYDIIRYIINWPHPVNQTTEIRISGVLNKASKEWLGTNVLGWFAKKRCIS